MGNSFMKKRKNYNKKKLIDNELYENLFYVSDRLYGENIFLL